MKRNPRRRVIRVEVTPNLGPSRDLFPDRARAFLECGHDVNLGVENAATRYRPKVMACTECPGAREVGRRAWP